MKPTRVMTRGQASTESITLILIVAVTGVLTLALFGRAVARTFAAASAQLDAGSKAGGAPAELGPIAGAEGGGGGGPARPAAGPTAPAPIRAGARTPLASGSLPAPTPEEDDDFVIPAPDGSSFDFVNSRNQADPGAGSGGGVGPEPDVRLLSRAPAGPDDGTVGRAPVPPGPRPGSARARGGRRARLAETGNPTGPEAAFTGLPELDRELGGIQEELADLDARLAAVSSRETSPQARARRARALADEAAGLRGRLTQFEQDNGPRSTLDPKFASKVPDEVEKVQRDVDAFLAKADAEAAGAAAESEPARPAPAPSERTVDRPRDVLRPDQLGNPSPGRTGNPSIDRELREVEQELADVDARLGAVRSREGNPEARARRSRELADEARRLRERVAVLEDREGPGNGRGERREEVPRAAGKVQGDIDRVIDRAEQDAAAADRQPKAVPPAPPASQRSVERLVPDKPGPDVPNTGNRDFDRELGQRRNDLADLDARLAESGQREKDPARRAEAARAVGADARRIREDLALFEDREGPRNGDTDARGEVPREVGKIQKDVDRVIAKADREEAEARGGGSGGK